MEEKARSCQTAADMPQAIAPTDHHFAGQKIESGGRLQPLLSGDYLRDTGSHAAADFGYVMSAVTF